MTSPILAHLEPKARHDLIGSLRTIRYAVEALRAGEHFDGPDGPEQLEALESAIRRVEEILEVRRAEAPPAADPR